ncbi:hypothetical protein [Chachezhania antarctica]|uniref:hypothetical protein n=1 Tax=Chachezhania antarctica TaxID=2340860 RepID=UPI000EAC9309|nr:hypothetical protein [Chachezhania antarctica]
MHAQADNIAPELVTLCDELDRLPQADMADRLCTAIMENDGLMALPSLNRRRGQAGYEFQVFGIRAIGHTQRAAAELWRCTARTSIGGYDAPAVGDMVVLQAQLRWLQSAMIIRMSPDTRHRWATLVMAISTDHGLLTRADAVLRASVPMAAE